MNEPKRQHYVQKAYLDRWSNSGGAIYVCELGSGKIWPASPASIAFEKYYYCIADPEHPERKYEIEEFLATDIEGPVGPILDKLDKEELLNPEERDKLALYIAFQKTRVPFFEHFSNDISEKLTRKSLLKTLKDEAHFAGFLKSYADKLKNKYIPTREELISTIEEDRVDIKFPRAHSLKYMLLLAIPISDLYFKSLWTVLDGHSSNFITSDNPATTISLAGMSGKEGVSETVFPISPTHALLINQSSTGTFATTEEDPEGVREINRRTLMHATRFLFGNSEKILQENYAEHVRLKPLIDAARTAHKDGKPVPTNGEKLFTKRMRQD